MATLFSPTFKVEENKVPLFLGSEVKWMGQGKSSTATLELTWIVVS